MNRLAHHCDLSGVGGLRATKDARLAKVHGDSWFNFFKSTMIDVNFRLVRVGPLLHESLGKLRFVCNRSILAWLVKSFLDETSESSLLDLSRSRRRNWSLNVLARREKVINGRTNILVGKVRVQDKWLIAQLLSRSIGRIGAGLLFLSGVSDTHCSGNLSRSMNSAAGARRSMNRSNWSRFQRGDKRWLHASALKAGEFMFLHAREIGDESRWVRMLVSLHSADAYFRKCGFVLKIIYWPIYPPYKGAFFCHSLN